MGSDSNPKAIIKAKGIQGRVVSDTELKPKVKSELIV